MEYYIMGQDRDTLIRRLGGTPSNEYKMSDEEILRLARETYKKRGDIPPDVRIMLEELKKIAEKNKGKE